MKKVGLILLMFLLKNVVTAQDQDKEVSTPFGPALKSNLHYVGNRYNINNNNYCTQIILTNTGKVSQEFSNDLSNKSIDYRRVLFDNKAEFKDGWITYATGQVYVSNPNVTYFTTDWIVPSPPNRYSRQLLYLFSGLGGGMQWSEIVQPVLQWGISPAGGGDYWAICNWYAAGNGEFYYDSLIKVSPGTRLKGVIKLTSVSNNQFSYNSFFQGYSSGLQVNNISHLSTPLWALEAYNVQGCDEYPSDEKIKMFDIKILNDSVYPPMKWFSYTNSENGQYTRIINERADNGQIDIHFHTPYSVDGFTEIHIYPNPVVNTLHISPNYLENILKLYPDEPITNCKIEIFNSLGKLVQNCFYEKFDFEFDLDMRNFQPGLYIITFTYNNKTHSFKIIKS
jgi:hypothetical protein